MIDITTMTTETFHTTLRQHLESLVDPKYQVFSNALVPGETQMLGIRIPQLRVVAKELSTGDWQHYVTHASDASMEEIMLQGMVIGYAKVQFLEKIPFLQAFLPKVTNWSVCDSVCVTLKFPKKETEQVWQFLQPYLFSKKDFEIRFGVVMLLDHFVTKDYLEKLFATFDAIQHPAYYVNMAIGWAVSTCFRSFKSETIAYLMHCQLSDLAYQKALQKIIESRYSSPEEKDLMRSMKTTRGCKNPVVS